jgi:IMP dehydrogenase
MEVIKGYSYDDLLLIPGYSELESRREVLLKSKVGNVTLELPVLSAPMDTVTEENMATFMWEKGGLGVIHRYNTVNRQFTMVKWVKDMGCRVGAAVGINGDSKERIDALVEADVDLICIDIAHGYARKALEIVSYIKSLADVTVMSGNIVTEDAALAYLEAGADVLRVGVGPGSACTTRQVAGVGFPQLSAIANIREYLEYFQYKVGTEWKFSIVADGGIKNSGDAVKALAAGADAVMIGGMLAPFVVAAGRTLSVKAEEPTPKVFPGTERYVTMKEFRGMASEDALSERKDNYVVEGESFLVPVRYDQEEFINQFRDGMQQGLAYCGSRNLAELRANAEWVEVTNAGFKEGTPHFAKGVKK